MPPKKPAPKGGKDAKKAPNKGGKKGDKREKKPREEVTPDEDYSFLDPTKLPLDLESMLPVWDDEAIAEEKWGDEPPEDDKKKKDSKKAPPPKKDDKKKGGAAKEEAKEEAPPHEITDVYEDPEGEVPLHENLKGNIEKWVRPVEYIKLICGELAPERLELANQPPPPVELNDDGEPIESVVLPQHKEDYFAPVIVYREHEEEEVDVDMEGIDAADKNVRAVRRFAPCLPEYQWLQSTLILISSHYKLFGDGEYPLWDNIYPKGEDGLPRYNPAGKYVVKVYAYGAWRKLTVDDKLPVDFESNAVFIQSSEPRELWPAILCKALMKLSRASPDSIGETNSYVHWLTGWLPARKPLPQTEEGEETWALLNDLMINDPRCVVGCLPEGEVGELEEVGIFKDQVYSVCQVREILGHKLISLKAAAGKWAGPFSDVDYDTWSPELEIALGERLQQRIEDDVEDFWMELADFSILFPSLYLLQPSTQYSCSETLKVEWSDQEKPFPNRPPPLLKVKSDQQTDLVICASAMPEKNFECLVPIDVTIKDYHWDSVQAEETKFSMQIYRYGCETFSVPAGDHLFAITVESERGHFISIFSEMGVKEVVRKLEPENKEEADGENAPGEENPEGEERKEGGEASVEKDEVSMKTETAKDATAKNGTENVPEEGAAADATANDITNRSASEEPQPQEMTVYEPIVPFIVGEEDQILKEHFQVDVKDFRGECELREADAWALWFWHVLRARENTSVRVAAKLIVDYEEVAPFVDLRFVDCDTFLDDQLLSLEMPARVLTPNTYGYSLIAYSKYPNILLPTPYTLRLYVQEVKEEKIEERSEGEEGEAEGEAAETKEPAAEGDGDGEVPEVLNVETLEEEAWEDTLDFTYTTDRFRIMFRKSLIVSENARFSLIVSSEVKDALMRLTLFHGQKELKVWEGYGKIPLHGLRLPDPIIEDDGTEVHPVLQAEIEPNRWASPGGKVPDEIPYKIEFIGSNDVEIVPDTEKEDRQQDIKESWRAEDPKNRAALAKAAREKFLNRNADDAEPARDDNYERKAAVIRSTLPKDNNRPVVSSEKAREMGESVIMAREDFGKHYKDIITSTVEKDHLKRNPKLEGMVNAFTEDRDKLKQVRETQFNSRAEYIQKQKDDAEAAERAKEEAEREAAIAAGLPPPKEKKKKK